jgi:chemotaxis protein methyltransferase CheR
MSVIAEQRQREFVFSDADFEYLRKLVESHTGISLSDAKRDLVYGRLSRRLRALGMRSFNEYCQLLDSDDDTELENFVNAITTNLTSFFREPHHFEFLANTALPALMKNRQQRRLRIWSAGCSTGEEPYTLTIAVKEAIHSLDGWDVRILATDLDTDVVESGKTGIYREEKIEGLSRTRKKNWFRAGNGENKGKVRVSPELQNMITFKPLNLMNEWPMKGPFDVIFCRNVVIYFDKDTQKILFNRYADILADDGYLFIGHSEALYKVTDRFELIGKTIYRKRY